MRQEGRHSNGAGCGYANVLITGRIRFADDHPPAAVRFRSLKEGMLMGSRDEHGIPVRYDPATGRFACFAEVFASYSHSMNDDDEDAEPGPFQTGSLDVEIDADGAKPLLAKFYDEMPDVLLTLEPVPPAAP